MQNKLPFYDFMDYLRRLGFIIGVEHHLRLQVLLNKLDPDCKPEELKYLLCPVFAVSEKQQNQFYRAFDSFFKPLYVEAKKESKPGAAKKAETSESVEEQTAPPKWQYILLGFLLLVNIVLVVYRPGEKPGVTEPSAHKEVIRTAKPTPTPSATTGPLTSPEAGQEIIPTAKPQQERTFFKLYGYIFRWVGLLSPFIFLFLLEIYKYNRRRLILLRQRGKKPPLVWPIKVETPDPEIVKSKRFYQAAFSLRQRLKSDVRRFDVEKTVSDTIENGGFPVFRSRRLTKPPEYLILIDLPDYKDHYAHMFDNISVSLASEGIFVKRYFYQKDPRVCFEEPGSQRIYLTDLKTRYSDHRLIIFGDGEELLDPLSGGLDNWTVLFRDWQERAFLTPELAKDWSVRELALAREFIVLPASLDGLCALVDHFELSRTTDLKRWKASGSLEISLPQGLENDVVELRRYLGEETFQWLCACAVYPELHWDLTLYLGTLTCMPESLVKEENLLRLIRLPWYRTGVMPDELRWELIGELDLEKSRSIRGAIIELLEKNPAPPGSFAYDDYRLHLVVQRWLLSKNVRKKRKELIESLKATGEERVIRDYTLLSFLEKEPKSRLSFLLPKRLRKVFYRKGVPLFGFNGLVRCALAVMIALVFFFVFKPAAPNPFSDKINREAQKIYKNDRGYWEAEFAYGIIMVHVPAGEFTMGSKEGNNNEKPEHKVFLDGYWIGKYEVTVSQFKEFVNDVGYKTDAEKSDGAYVYLNDEWRKKKDANWQNPYFTQGDNNPVVCVSWNDAAAYCEWLNKKAGSDFKLPTEAEWEKAARGRDGRVYPWGNKFDKTRCNSYESELNKTTPVGSYPAGVSPYGIMDMAGNVDEWCLDWYEEKYYEKSHDKNPIGPKDGVPRVLRGGGWISLGRGVRSAFRSRNEPSDRWIDSGFRLARGQKDQSGE
jgi:formylglycine-generating enzyme required for sulfatase activity